MQTKLVFKPEHEPTGYRQKFASNCKFSVKNSDGVLFLNYESRPERAVGFYKNLKQDGEAFVADIRLHEQVKSVEHRLEYAISGSILSKNEQGEATAVEITSVAALMDNKF